MSDFEHLTPGSVILEWSPSGELRRWVVHKRQHLQAVNICAMASRTVLGYDVLELCADDSLRVGARFLAAQDIEEQEGFGYTFTYLLGEVYALPEILKR